MNDRLAGESYPKADCDAVMVAWVSAMNLALAELLQTLPPQLTGLDEAAIESRLSDAFHQMRSDLGDLESSLWKQVYDRAMPATTTASKSKSARISTT